MSTKTKYETYTFIIANGACLRAVYQVEVLCNGKCPPPHDQRSACQIKSSVQVQSGESLKYL